MFANLSTQYRVITVPTDFSVSKYLLNAYYALGTLLGAMYIDTVPALMKLTVCKCHKITGRECCDRE